MVRNGQAVSHQSHRNWSWVCGQQQQEDRARSWRGYFSLFFLFFVVAGKGLEFFFLFLVLFVLVSSSRRHCVGQSRASLKRLKVVDDMAKAHDGPGYKEARNMEGKGGE